MGALTHVCLGHPGLEPSYGRLLVVERSKPTSAALYAARIAACKLVQTPYFSLLDGGGDVLLGDYFGVIEQMVEALEESEAVMAYTRERLDNVVLPSRPHHGVVVKTEDFLCLDLPKSGCFHFETLVYGALAKVHEPILFDRLVYDWRPSPGGASKWADTVRARNNSRLWLEGFNGVHFAHEGRE
jgi:hypothetical protein